MEAPNKQSKNAARKQRKKAAKANASLSSADAEGFYLFSLSSHCFLILNNLLITIKIYISIALCHQAPKHDLTKQLILKFTLFVVLLYILLFFKGGHEEILRRIRAVPHDDLQKLGALAFELVADYKVYSYIMEIYIYNLSNVHILKCNLVYDTLPTGY